MLLLISLLIPFLHWRVVDSALEYTRFMGGLMPVPYIGLKNLGALSSFGPVVILVLFLASFRWKELRSAESIAIVATAYAVCSTLYACCAAMAFAMWLEGFR